MSDKDHGSQLLPGLLFLSVAIALGAWFISDALVEWRRANDVITVTGSAKRAINADLIVWRGSLSVQEPTMPGSYALLRQRVERVKGYFKQNGLSDPSIVWSSIESQEIYETTYDGRSTGKIASYRLTQPFEVKSTEVDRVTDVSRRATELMSEDVPLVSFPPEYLTTKLADLRIEMLAEASKDARRRASTIADAAGFKVGAVRGARQGVFQITRRHSTEVSDYGINDTSSNEKEITAVVSVTFGIE